MVLRPDDLPILMNAGAVAIGIILLAIGRLLVVLTRLTRNMTLHGTQVRASLETIHEQTNSRLSRLDAMLERTQHELAQTRAELVRQAQRLEGG